MNARQTQILKSWRQHFRGFIKREWFSLFMSSSLGVLAAELLHVLWLDLSFQSYFISKYKPAVPLDELRYYLPYLSIVAILACIAISAIVFGYIWRGLKSCWYGVTSGLIVLPFASAFLLSILPSHRLHHRFLLGCAFVAVWLLASFSLYVGAKIRSERTVREAEFAVPPSVRSLAGTQLQESDDPIQSWAQDAVGRAALVDSLSVKIMIAKASVLMLSGKFGSGKTSTLNLLREHLENKAIVVSFSTWLPGSTETLTSYLLADIANESKKQFVVPGLRQSARRFATALGQKVPVLGDYLKLLPTPTQKDDIANLKSALVRLPKRVVVLLDEIDRMEKEELVTLLKVIRGISTLPNLSFVCAADRQTIVETVRGIYDEKNNEYFDKFFPVSISVPAPSPESLRKAGIERLVSTLVAREWFENDSDVKQFRKDVDELWDARIAPFCPNLRAIGLLANAVSVAAAPLCREVNPIDLTLVEMLNRFRPSVYELISKNSVVLTGGESMFRGGPFQTDQEKEAKKAKLSSDLTNLVPKEDELEKVKGVLSELFPLFSTSGSLFRSPRPKRKDSSEESDKRISEPGMFPAYFRYELPEAIFSSVEIASLVRRLELASSQADRDAVFLRTLNTMDKGSLKRDDFLRKLADLPKTIPVPLARSLGEAVAKPSAQYTYDMFPWFGESGHALRVILAVAQKLPQTERVAFLRKCILDTHDDTMAFRILTILPQQKDDSKIDVPVSELYDSFITRMRNRYGRSVDATNIDLSTSDPWAFNYWGSDFNTKDVKANPEDREIQNDFWLRYIGNSRARLAHAFHTFFMPIAVYSEDPALMVRNKISLEDLRRLYDLLPDDGSLASNDQKSLNRLRRLLDGEFNNGIDPLSDAWR